MPAKRVCSFDEFIEKRKLYPEIEIIRSGNGGLSDATVEACWERFINVENDSKE